ncbi:ribbon-helix-helix domain-containing protein [Zavarzinia sp. CC-PAN008]|uniref:ribbon-helix-helix domain-containing protein n=1 Tax=Zavarzinia sp. CC-PAN008 TaxID=3243332 RepID=UPI003F74A2B9
MAEPRHMVALTPEQHAFAAEKVASGEYDSIEEVVADALAALREEDSEPAFDRLLQEEIARRNGAFEADPSNVKTVEEVLANVTRRAMA